MSDRYPGGIVVANPTAPAGPYQDGAAPGIWTLEQQAYYKAQGLWPTAGNISPPTNSLRIRAANSAYLSRTPSSTTDRQKYTMSFWVKRGAIGSNQKVWFVGTGGDETGLQFYSGTNNDAVEVYEYTGGGYQYQLQTTQLFRDCSSWYHFVVAVDTTQATSSNRVKFYVNGSQVTAFATATYPSQNYNTKVNVSGTVNNFSKSSGSSFDGYLAEVNFVDGQQLTPSSFGITSATTGVWQPKLYSGSYGTNGYYLPFSDTSALTTSSNAGLGKDFSGNGNYFSTNNISITAGTTYDAMLDVPVPKSSTIGNFPTLNPLYQGIPASVTVNDGNLTLSFNSNPVFGIPSTMCFPSTGKWYCEVTAGAISGSYYWVGITDLSQRTTAALYPGHYSQDYSYGNGALKANNNSTSAYGSTWGNGDIIGVAVDCDTGTIEFYKNGSSQGTAFTGLTSMSTKTFIFGSGANSGTLYPNFGQRPFAYSLPSGYLALNTYNLSTPTIGASASTLANKYYTASLYTGTGANQSITNSGSFEPDFLWIKNRTGGNNHVLEDTIRGRGKNIASSSTSAQVTEDSTHSVTSFNSNGFSLGLDNMDIGSVNANGSSYVAWQWNAGSGSSSSNTNGSITSTVSVNQTSGFSVVTYTGNGSAGATVGHGLGVAPSMIMVKNISDTVNWTAYHVSIGGAGGFNFNTNQSAFTSDNGYWNSTNPTSSVFTVGSYAVTNTKDFVAYCFAPVAGFSAMGSYVGNGSSNGPFVYTGFRPAYILVKAAIGGTSNSQNWLLEDSARSPYNVISVNLASNTFGTEESGYNQADFLSNGFKMRSIYERSNENGTTYIYMAFAESPFKYALAR